MPATPATGPDNTDDGPYCDDCSDTGLILKECRDAHPIARQCACYCYNPTIIARHAALEAEHAMRPSRRRRTP